MAIASKKGMPERYSMYRIPRQSMHTYKVILHCFTIGDVEEPFLYAAEPIREWQQTDKGRWCLEHCEGEMVMHTQPDDIMWGYKVVIQGELSDKNLTYFKLKWGDVSFHR